jgi:glutathione S-transferase
MAIAFYYGSGSPYAWRVWLSLEHKRLPYELKLMSFAKGDLRTEEFSRLNPRHKVPVIVDGDFVLYESVAIVEYLDECYPDAGDGPLFPADPRARARVRRLIQETDHYLAAAVVPMLRQLFSTAADKRDAGVIAEGREKTLEEFARLEGEVQGDFLAGALSAAVYGMAALCLRVDRADPGLNLRAGLGPKTRNWMQTVESLPYFAATIPPHWRNA